MPRETVLSAEPPSPTRLPVPSKGRRAKPIGIRRSPAPWLQSIERWWYVLRYYRWRQLGMRLLKIANERMPPRRTINRRKGRVLPLRHASGLERWARDRLLGTDFHTASIVTEQLAARRITFLHDQRRLSNPVDWRCSSLSDVSKLWRFHLHYHEFLIQLAAVTARGDSPPANEARDLAWDMVNQWIDGAPPDMPQAGIEAWHPYCMSRRLRSWILLWSASPPLGALADRVNSSLAEQATHLRKHLEWDVRGNHLLENARALVLAGAFFAGPDAEGWLREGGELIQRELDEQVLPHGEHVERSPMYHSRMLEIVLDVRDVCQDLLPRLAESLDGTALQMASFLRAILHPDGEIPLLGDSCFSDVAPTQSLLCRVDSRSEGQGRSATTSATACGDTWVFRSGEDFLVFDAGPVGADHLPAHAHADLLNIEASWNGQRLFVDSGVFNYSDDAQRSYFRSTGAHNVLQIDGEDQCDLWSRFRMGYRGWPSGLKTGQRDGYWWAHAEHNAYRRLGVPAVGRFWACKPQGPWLCVDWADGRGWHALTNRLNLHPDVSVTRDGEVGFELCCGGKQLHLWPLAAGRMCVVPAWYSPEFGLRLESRAISWEAVTNLPAVTGWVLAPDSCSRPLITVETSSDDLWTVRCVAQGDEFVWRSSDFQ